MLLRWSLGREDAAQSIEAAVNRTLDDGFRTKDLLPPSGGNDAGAAGSGAGTAPNLHEVGTVAMTAAILERLGSPAAAPATLPG
jgi:isocitrate/isopropylmalate dehydrogenase